MLANISTNKSGPTCCLVCFAIILLEQHATNISDFHSFGEYILASTFPIRKAIEDSKHLKLENIPIEHLKLQCLAKKAGQHVGAYGKLNNMQF